MSSHELWHVAVLSTTLLAAAGVGVLALAPLVFDSPPHGLRRSRPIVLGLVGVAAALLILEWLGVHGR